MALYCPAGDGAFDDWVERCPECGRTLVDQPPTEAVAAHGGEIVRLTTAPNEPEAMMWANTLRDAGISVMLRPGGPGAGAWASSATFEHEVFVHERDYEQAKQLVRSLLTGGGSMTRSPARRQQGPRVNPVIRHR